MSFPFNKEFLAKGLTYNAHRRQMNEALALPPVDEAAEKVRPYFIKNVPLMDTYDESYRVSESLKNLVNAAPATTWVVITEGWCGDAAFNVPLLAALEKAVPEKIKLSLFLRDSNLELIDAYLTDGGRSIPKVIVLNQDLKKLGTWGPRPAALQTLMKQWKSEGLVLKDLIPKVKEWYDADNTRSLQEKLSALVKSYTANSKVS